MKKTCSSAKTQSTTAISQQSHCQAFQSTGCYYNGVDNCTDGGCASYFFGDNCNTISTAKDNSEKTLSCVKDTTQSNNQCKNKACADAAPSVANLFNTDTLCNAWLTGCVTDGTKCVDPTSTQCSAYKGTQDQCTKFSYKPTPTTSQKCTKVAKFCQAFTTCAAHFIPSTLTSTNDKSIDCQLVVESTDSQNCMFDSSTLKCANPTTCDKYVTTFTGAQAQSYCNKLKIKSKSCWWSTGNSCAIVEDCTSFTILNGSLDKEAAAQCQKLSPNGSTFCGFIATATKCSARSCSDFGIGATSVQDCINYLATCEDYSTLGFCYTKKTNCADYTINSTIYDTSIKKAKYCSSIESNNSKCSYDQKTDKCVVAGGCQYVTFSESSEPDESEKQAICLNSRNYGGQICVYIRSLITKCSEPADNCNIYNMSGDLSHAERQAYCQNMVNSNGDTCNYALGIPSCMDYQYIPRIVQCNQYYTYQSTDADNLKFCSNLTPTKNGPKCSYSLRRPESCSDFGCSDQSSTTCANYPSLCIYSGISCISLQATCAGYTIETSATDKTVYCKQLTGTTGSKKCAYNGATSTTNCSDRACADLASSDSQKTCTDYLSTCTYDGTKCVSSLDCTTITLTGTTDSDKVTFCNKLGNGKNCTFVSGGDKCVTTKTDCKYPIGALTITQALAACSVTQDSNGKYCGYSTGNTCEARSCVNTIKASSTQDCVDWLAGCELDSTSSCEARNCNDAPITLNTDTLCGEYKSGCLTTLKGCIDSNQPCSQYKGDATQCQSFTGNYIKCNNKNPIPTVNDSCVDKTCADNTVALNNADCDKWYPSKCIWNGTKGCWDNTKNCADFQGTVDSCKIYKAADGPCSGTGLGTTLAACYSNNICTNAPKSITTDSDCKTWHSNCVTNGFGCIPKTSKCTDIIDTSVCSSSALNCSPTGKQCLTKPTICSQFATASDCNNLLLFGATSASCGWDTTRASLNCVDLTCELLPGTLTTDGQCASRLTQGTCTTSGAGCVTKDFCSNYKSQAICQNAKSKDAQGSCAWENISCRPIKCEDKTGTSDDVCNTYLTGCRTNGVSCVSSAILICQNLSRNVCLKDGSGNPCYWFQGMCQQYVACTSLSLTSHATCQLASPFCTTDGTKCVAIDKCAKLPKTSCFIGTDGTCGYGQTSTQTAQQCQIFTSCSAFNGTSAEDCASWGTKCISDGTKCIDQSSCASYLTQASCGNLGTDGKCQWVAGTGATGTCRLRQCSDATAADVQSLTTYVGCNSFVINSSTKCNTNGTSCVALGTCSTYQVQAACQVGTDGDCFWATANSSTNTTQSCGLKTCTDLSLTTSSQCAVAISKVDCVSDGTKCIPKAACSSYTTKEACSGKGTDGQCVFTPTNSTSPNLGTCKVFTLCSDADSDSIACNTNPSCHFLINGTSTTCSQHTCASKAQGSLCNPIPNFDLSTYSICVLSGTQCVAGNPNSLSQGLCYEKSVYSYTWNPSSQTCQACKQISINNTVNNTNNQTNTFEKLLCCLALSLILM